MYSTVPQQHERCHCSLTRPSASLSSAYQFCHPSTQCSVVALQSIISRQCLRPPVTQLCYTILQALCGGIARPRCCVMALCISQQLLMECGILMGQPPSVTAHNIELCRRAWWQVQSSL